MENNPAVRGRRADGDGVRGKEDERLLQKPETNPESGGLEKLTDSNPEESAAPTVAREAPCKVSSHASAEVWPNQVRPYFN
ncbi:hypothetical protein NDU88_002811 [Pleurodeles waltl]|uniref:Uncharacterized protein n=1 Tax=Pleurodeles waltl TaxID=8319 RepID=A0AAV7P841_PLEWA|nr:hypothetical protein NDU88_002811 [Pleurodeles waltl]